MSISKRAFANLMIWIVKGHATCKDKERSLNFYGAHCHLRELQMKQESRVFWRKRNFLESNVIANALRDLARDDVEIYPV
jgi:hypothetical protein